MTIAKISLYCILKKTRIEKKVLPKKFYNLKALVIGMLDILIISETKLNNTFPVSQFHIDGYSKPYRLEIEMGVVQSYMSEKTYQVEC